jgi:Rv0078B-related antitoxin
VDVYPLDLVDEMFDLGVELRRERARRESPELDEAAIDAIVDAWLVSRPAAPMGDSVGTAGTWPRR